MKECKGWSDPLRPSRDQSGGLSILGYGVSLRNAEFRNTGAQNQYFIAIKSFIDSCHQWARFEITDESYRHAKIALSRWAENTMTSEAYSSALAQLKEAFEQAPSADTAPYSDDAAVQVNTPSIDVMARFDALDRRLTEVYDRLPKLPTTTQQPVIVRFGIGSALPESQSSNEALEMALAFSQSCQRPRFILVGYADPSGSSAANVLLGLHRAMKVGDLIHQALDRGSILAVSGGSTEKFGTNPAENRAVVVEMRCHED